MLTEPGFFRDLAYVFLAALLGGGLAWITRQPLILGYVVGGIAIGPFTPGPVVTHTHTFELGAAFLCADLGITPEPREDHASYLAHWLEILRDDKRALFAAAAHAQRAVDFLHSRASREEAVLQPVGDTAEGAP